MIRSMALCACMTFACLAVGFPALGQEPEDGVVSEPPATTSDSASSRPDERAPMMAEPTVSPSDQAYLGMWIDYLGRTARRNRLNAGSNMVVGSALALGFGIPLYVTRNPGTELNKGIGFSLIAFSGAFMAGGIVELVRKSAAENGAERWKAASKSPLSPRELGRFEGELRAYADSVRKQALLARWMNFGMGVTGALILGLTPAADLSRDAATLGYVLGGVMAGFGFLNFGFSFRKESRVDYWKAYLEGSPPPAMGGRWTLAPSAGLGFAGARLTGRF